MEAFLPFEGLGTLKARYPTRAHTTVYYKDVSLETNVGQAGWIELSTRPLAFVLSTGEGRTTFEEPKAGRM